VASGLAPGPGRAAGEAARRVRRAASPSQRTLREPTVPVFVKSYFLTESPRSGNVAAFEASVARSRARSTFADQTTRGGFVASHGNDKQGEGVRALDITGVRVFSATKAKEREMMGDIITDWLRKNPDLEIVDRIVTQSSDSEFHCLTITLFYRNGR
jgi:hypothetical protein